MPVSTNQSPSCGHCLRHRQNANKSLSLRKKAYAELDPDQRDARDIRQMKDMFDKIQTAFVEGLVEASDNFQASKGQKNATEDGGVKLMVRENVVDRNGHLYKKVVKPGLTIYEKVKHSRQAYVSHLRNKIFNRTFNLQDNDSANITVEFAKNNERIKKDGDKSPRRVLGELESTSDKLKMIAIINIRDLLKNSKPLTPNNENSHQWLDAEGWGDRIAYMLDNDAIYPVILHIPKTRDGRHILYDISVIKNEGSTVDIDATARASTNDGRASTTHPNESKPAVKSVEPSGNRLTQLDPVVNTESAEAADTSSNQTLAAQPTKNSDRQNKNRASNGSPLTRRSVKQRSVGSTHIKMPSTAAAEKLGIKNIAKYSDSVKEAVAVLGELFTSVDLKKPVLGFKRPVSASSLEGALVAMGVLKREGTSGSAYRYDDGHALRISNHSAHANNFVGDGEHLSIALFEQGKMNKFVEGESNVIEAVFRQKYLDGNTDALKQVIHDIAHFIADGEYHDTAGAMRYNFSGTEAFKKQAQQRMADDKSARGRKFSEKDSNAGQVKSVDNTTPTTNKDIRYSDRDYSYEALTSKPNMAVTTVGGNVPNNRADVAQLAKKNAAKVGRFDPKTGSVSVYVDDIDTDVILSTKGLRHGLRRTQDPLNEPNYIVTVKAGEILKNSIRINEITPSDENANSSYVLMGAARDTNGVYVVRFVVNHFDNNVMAMDVLYAVNAKKELAATKSPRLTAEPLSVTSSTISIAELLDLVNHHFPDILPEDVLKHYGYDSRPEGDLGDDALYQERTEDSVSNRSLLADAIEGITKNSDEYKMIQRYKGRINILNELEEKLSKLNAEIREIRFGRDGKYDADKLKRLEAEAKNVANEINKQDKKILAMEASEPLWKGIVAVTVAAASANTGGYISFAIGKTQTNPSHSTYNNIKADVRKRTSAFILSLTKGINKQNQQWQRQREQADEPGVQHLFGAEHQHQADTGQRQRAQHCSSFTDCLGLLTGGHQHNPYIIRQLDLIVDRHHNGCSSYRNS